MQGKIFGKKLASASLLVAAALLAGCNLVKDDTDCVRSYNILQFSYEYNMKYTCAFGNEVEAVTVLIFDRKTGTLCERFDMPRSALGNDYSMAVELDPGDYDFLVWGGDYKTNYNITQGEIGKATMADFDCYLNRTREDDGTDHIREDIAGLYHGQVSASLPYSSPSKPNIVKIPLKKNTNTVRVVLQHLTDDPVNADDFEFEISDNNGWLDHNSNLKDDDALKYHPWFVQSGSVDVNQNPQDAPGTKASAIPEVFRNATRSALGASLAELTVNRLVKDNEYPPMLTIRKKSDGGTVLSVPLIDYALLVKGFYHKDMTDQEYLDRQDEYNMTFFLDRGNKWVDAVIIINNWRIENINTPVE